MHQETWVKVNAPVDSGIADLVSALGEIEQLQTLESCQGTPGNAFVYFWYGEDWKPMADVVFNVIAPALKEQYEATVSISVFGESKPMAKITMPPDSIPAVTAAIYAISHKNPCSQMYRWNEIDELERFDMEVIGM